ncbi:MAG TPA: fumarylacetoacetate hydrolase family protein [Stellaceae bacterium]|nr:fumarylacetoacetate hydrolase family protein [Stellaceae bacterium]
MSTAAGSAAALLVEARQSGRRLPGLAAERLPGDDEAAYAVQEAVIRRLGVAVAGWKVGAANAAAAPSAAPLFAPLVRPSPAVFAVTPENFRAVEAELALSLARDLPPRARPYGEDEVWDAVAAAHVAIELLDTRYESRDKMSPAALLADNLSNAGFCHGPPIAGWRAIDFLTVEARLAIDGHEVKRAVGGNPAGHPRRLLAWLANHAASRGRPLRSGDIVTTGSHTGVAIAPPGARVAVRFAGLGEAVLTLAGPDERC